MTKEQLIEWIKTAKRIDSDGEYDNRTNYWSYEIYEKDGQLFQVEYCNYSPMEKWGDKGFIKGVYEPKKVKRIVVKTEEIRYE